ncbi:MAG: ABC transporter substrate-binding protein [Candidatus Magnetominusculus sp. LBB02]|nr:ABC transporter substrate-binding protein [Candidatus Magnetominusculus sp. LBB02]
MAAVIGRKVFLYAIAVALAVSAALYLLSIHSGVKNKIPKKVTIASVSDLQAALVNMAFVKGYFKDEGLDVDIIQHTFGRAALKTMIEGKADFAAVGETPLMMSILKGDKVYILSAIQNSSKVTVAIARKDSGIASINDLKGKTIASSKGTTGDYFLYLLCLIHNVKYSELKIIDKKPDEMLNLIVKGEVDAVATWQGHAMKILKNLSDKIIFFQGEGIYTETFALTAKQDYVRGNPEIVERVLAALYRAEQYMRKEPVKSQELLADYCKTDPDMMRELWVLNNFELTLDQYLIKLLENETQWAINEKIVDSAAEPNYLDYVYLNALKKIKPYAITIIK